MKLTITAFLLFSWITFPLLAQEKTVEGKVTGAEDGQAVIGATVMQEGTTRGTITDVQGEFQMEAPVGATIVVSFVGMEQHSFKVGEQDYYEIVLSAETEELDEVVVIGYGTRKKRDIIGSVSSVTSDELGRTPTASFTEALQGKAAGVQVSTSSGVPGAPTTVRIRGNSSISINTSPLWIIDGMPVYSGGGLERTIGSTGQDPMSMINMNDIESIQVLKDAEATSIYGSRGSNGVIIVTTKRGEQGRSTTSVNIKSGIIQLGKQPEEIGFANTREWLTLVDSARANSGLPPFIPFDIYKFFKDDPLAEITREEAELVNIDWFDQILRTGYYQDINISSSRGTEKSSHYISLNYNNTEGNPMKNFFKRFSARANVDFNPLENLTMGSRINLTYTNNNRVQQQVGGATGNNSGGANAGFGNANRVALPWMPIYNPGHPSGYWNPMSGANLVASMDPDNHFDEVDAYRVLGNLFAEYNVPFIKGLRIRSEAGVDFIQNNSVFWVSDVIREDGSFAADRAVTRRGFNYNVYANYNRTFAENHSIALTFGSEWFQQNQYIRNAEGQDLTGTYQQLGSPSDILGIYAGLNREEYMWGYIGRGQYKFKEKYLAGFSLRRDASSRFDEDYRWETFPSFSLGWIISEESFFSGIQFVNFLKLRGSYGETGNKDIPPNVFQTILTNDLEDRYGDASLISGGTRISNLGTPTLTWETTNSLDFGIDFGLLQNKINGSVAYYRQDITDLLLFSELPPSSGVSGIWNNIGDMRNEGIEFSVNSVNVHNTGAGFKWTTRFNITMSDDEVLSLTPRYDEEGLGVNRGRTISKTGMNLWNYYINEWAGVDPERGVDMIYEIDYEHWEETGETVKTGRIIPATQTNLGRNRIIMEGKTSQPKYFGGFDNTFEYKGFDLSIFFTFTGGHYIYDYEEQRTTSVQYGQVVLRDDLFGNTWVKPGDEARYPELRWNSEYDWGWNINKPNPEWTGDPDDPRATGYWTHTDNEEDVGIYNNETAAYSKYLYKGDYIRLRTLQLGYNFPFTVTEKLKLQKMRVYLSASNLWLWTLEYEGWDPESGGGQLPIPRIYTFGLNVTF